MHTARHHIIQVFTLVFFSLFIACLSDAAQEGAVTGKVVSDEGGLSGVSIVVKGSHRGTSTGPDGSFRILLGPGDKSLIISQSGYETLSVDAREAASILLKKENRQLEDVIVTGYSTQSRKFIAGSITSVSGDAIKNSPAAGFNQLLQGKAAGVQVTANSGAAGGSITFR